MSRPKVIIRDDKVKVKTPHLYNQYFNSIISSKYIKKKGIFEFPVEAIPEITDRTNGLELDAEDKFWELDEELRKKQEKTNEILTKKEPKKFDRYPFLMRHQARCVELAEVNDKFAMFLDTGTGKTITAYSIMDMKASKFLVVCPKSIILTAWKDDMEQFFPHLKVLYMTKDYTKTQYKEMAKEKGYKGNEYMEFLKEWAQIIIINPEYFKTIDDELVDLVNGLVVDESVMMANIKSQTTKQLISFGEQMKYVYLLSGNPAPNSNLQYHPQMHVVDPSLFSTEYYKFRAVYFYQADYMGYTYEMKPEKFPIFTEKLSKKSIIIKKKDCLDLKEPVYQKRTVDLPKNAMKSYKKMEREYVTMVESGELITVQSKIASLMKLRQLSSGFIYDEEHNSIYVHKAKVTETMNFLDEVGNEQVIIWINFLPEITMLTEKLDSKDISYTTAYSGTKSISESVNRFKRGEARIMIANPKTLKYGQTLVNCTYALYFSESYSYDDYKQSRDRIYRKGQNDQVTFVFIQAKDTIDMAIHENVTNKGNASELVERYIKDAQERL